MGDAGPGAQEQTLHIINAFETALRGSERAAIAAAARLSSLGPVKLWSTVAPPRAVGELARAAGLALDPIRPFAGALPRGGRLLIWGTHYDIGIWLRASRAGSVAILCELLHQAALYRALLDVRAAGLPEPRVVYVSTLLRDACVWPGPVIYPPADLATLFGIAREPGRSPTVGRVSRDIPEKHHAGDPGLYTALAAAGIRVRILGGSCLRNRIAPSPLIELLPEGSVAVADFLAGLDLFFYRTAGPGVYVEPSGLVVAEAMAAGLAVVVGAPGGFTDLVRDGETGRVVTGEAQARAAILQLAADPASRARLGDAARAAVRAYFGPGYAARLHACAFGTPAL